MVTCNISLGWELREISPPNPVKKNHHLQCSQWYPYIHQPDMSDFLKVCTLDLTSRQSQFSKNDFGGLGSGPEAQHCAGLVNPGIEFESWRAAVCIPWFTIHRKCWGRRDKRSRGLITLDLQTLLRIQNAC